MYIYMHVCMYVHVHVCTCMYVHVCMDCIWNVHVCSMYMYMYVCMYVYMHDTCNIHGLTDMWIDVQIEFIIA